MTTVTMVEKDSRMLWMKLWSVKSLNSKTDHPTSALLLPSVELRMLWRNGTDLCHEDLSAAHAAFGLQPSNLGLHKSLNSEAPANR